MPMSPFESLKGLLAEYGGDDVDSVELVRAVRGGGGGGGGGSPTYRRCRLVAFVVETGVTVDLELVTVDPPLPWVVVAEWSRTRGESGECAGAERVLARFEDRLDAAVWAYQKMADTFGPVCICCGAGIPHTALESLGWIGGVVTPRGAPGSAPDPPGARRR